MEQVATDLSLTSVFLEDGKIQTSQRSHFPFKYEQTILVDNINTTKTYKIVTDESGFEIADLTSDKTIMVVNHDTYTIDHKLPFQIKIQNYAT